MVWKVTITRRALKQIGWFDESVLLVLQLLSEDLKAHGPFPGKHWPNYGKLHGKKQEDKRHCHLMKGHPTYVCCWEVVDKKNRTIEVYYVGTHEKAPY